MHDRSIPRITAVIPAKNEARQIVDCIATLRGFATEILVMIDDGTTDDTEAVASTAGARVVNIGHPVRSVEMIDKTGFLHATGEWIYMLDADERLTPGLATRLLEVARENRFAGVRFARKNMMFGGWARHGGWFKNDQLRFFRADAWDRNWACPGHSQVPVSGPILTLPLREELASIHWDYDSVSQFIGRTLLRYSQQEAIERYEAGIRFSAWRFMLRPVRRFLGRYIVRGGWRDGSRGLVLAALLAAYDLCIEACLWDIGRRGRDAGK